MRTRKRKYNLTKRPVKKGSNKNGREAWSETLYDRVKGNQRSARQPRPKAVEISHFTSGNLTLFESSQTCLENEAEVHESSKQEENLQDLTQVKNKNPWLAPKMWSRNWWLSQSRAGHSSVLAQAPSGNTDSKPQILVKDVPVCFYGKSPEPITCRFHGAKAVLKSNGLLTVEKPYRSIFKRQPVVELKKLSLSRKRLKLKKGFAVRTRQDNIRPRPKAVSSSVPDGLKKSISIDMPINNKQSLQNVISNSCPLCGSSQSALDNKNKEYSKSMYCEKHRMNAPGEKSNAYSNFKHSTSVSSKSCDVSSLKQDRHSGIIHGNVQSPANSSGKACVRQGLNGMSSKTDLSMVDEKVKGMSSLLTMKINVRTGTVETITKLSNSSRKSEPFTNKPGPKSSKKRHHSHHHHRRLSSTESLNRTETKPAKSHRHSVDGMDRKYYDNSSLNSIKHKGSDSKSSSLHSNKYGLSRSQVEHLEMNLLKTQSKDSVSDQTKTSNAGPLRLSISRHPLSPEKKFHVEVRMKDSVTKTPVRASSKVEQIDRDGHESQSKKSSMSQSGSPYKHTKDGKRYKVSEEIRRGSHSTSKTSKSSPVHSEESFDRTGSKASVDITTNKAFAWINQKCSEEQSGKAVSSVSRDKSVKDQPLSPSRDKSVKDQPLSPSRDKSVKDQPLTLSPSRDKSVKDQPLSPSRDKSVKDQPLSPKSAEHEKGYASPSRHSPKSLSPERRSVKKVQASSSHGRSFEKVTEPKNSRTCDFQKHSGKDAARTSPVLQACGKSSGSETLGSEMCSSPKKSTPVVSRVEPILSSVGNLPSASRVEPILASVGGRLCKKDVAKSNDSSPAEHNIKSNEARQVKNLAAVSSLTNLKKIEVQWKNVDLATYRKKSTEEKVLEVGETDEKSDTYSLSQKTNNNDSKTMVAMMDDAKEGEVMPLTEPLCEGSIGKIDPEKLNESAHTGSPQIPIIQITPPEQCTHAETLKLTSDKSPLEESESVEFGVMNGNGCTPSSKESTEDKGTSSTIDSSSTHTSISGAGSYICSATTILQTTITSPQAGVSKDQVNSHQNVSTQVVSDTDRMLDTCLSTLPGGHGKVTGKTTEIVELQTHQEHSTGVSETDVQSICDNSVKLTGEAIPKPDTMNEKVSRENSRDVEEQPNISLPACDTVIATVSENSSHASEEHKSDLPLHLFTDLASVPPDNCRGLSCPHIPNTLSGNSPTKANDASESLQSSVSIAEDRCSASDLIQTDMLEDVEGNIQQKLVEQKEQNINDSRLPNLVSNGPSIDEVHAPCVAVSETVGGKTSDCENFAAREVSHDATSNSKIGQGGTELDLCPNEGDIESNEPLDAILSDLVPDTTDGKVPDTTDGKNDLVNVKQPYISDTSGENNISKEQNLEKDETNMLGADPGSRVTKVDVCVQESSTTPHVAKSGVSHLREMPSLISFPKSPNLSSNYNENENRNDDINPEVNLSPHSAGQRVTDSNASELLSCVNEDESVDTNALEEGETYDDNMQSDNLAYVSPYNANATHESVLDLSTETSAILDEQTEPCFSEIIAMEVTIATTALEDSGDINTGDTGVLSADGEDGFAEESSEDEKLLESAVRSILPASPKPLSSPKPTGTIAKPNSQSPLTLDTQSQYMAPVSSGSRVVSNQGLPRVACNLDIPHFTPPSVSPDIMEETHLAVQDLVNQLEQMEHIVSKVESMVSKTSKESSTELPTVPLTQVTKNSTNQGIHNSSETVYSDGELSCPSVVSDNNRKIETQEISNNLTENEPDPKNYTSTDKEVIATVETLLSSVEAIRDEEKITGNTSRVVLTSSAEGESGKNGETGTTQAGITTNNSSTDQVLDLTMPAAKNQVEEETSLISANRFQSITDSNSLNINESDHTDSEQNKDSDAGSLKPESGSVIMHPSDDVCTSHQVESPVKVPNTATWNESQPVSSLPACMEKEHVHPSSHESDDGKGDIESENLNLDLHQNASNCGDVSAMQTDFSMSHRVTPELGEDLSCTSKETQSVVQDVLKNILDQVESSSSILGLVIDNVVSVKEEVFDQLGFNAAIKTVAEMEGDQNMDSLCCTVHPLAQHQLDALSKAEKDLQKHLHAESSESSVDKDNILRSNRVVSSVYDNDEETVVYTDYVDADCGDGFGPLVIVTEDPEFRADTKDIQLNQNQVLENNSSVPSGGPNELDSIQMQVEVNEEGTECVPISSDTTHIIASHFIDEVYNNSTGDLETGPITGFSKESKNSVPYPLLLISKPSRHLQTNILPGGEPNKFSSNILKMVPGDKGNRYKKTDKNMNQKQRKTSTKRKKGRKKKAIKKSYAQGQYVVKPKVRRKSKGQQPATVAPVKVFHTRSKTKADGQQRKPSPKGQEGFQLEDKEPLMEKDAKADVYSFSEDNSNMKNIIRDTTRPNSEAPMAQNNSGSSQVKPDRFDCLSSDGSESNLQGQDVLSTATKSATKTRRKTWKRKKPLDATGRSSFDVNKKTARKKPEKRTKKKIGDKNPQTLLDGTVVDAELLEEPELPTILPPKRRRQRQLHGRIAAAMTSSSSTETMQSTDRIAIEFTRHNWLENKIKRLNSTGGMDTDDPGENPVQGPSPQPEEGELQPVRSRSCSSEGQKTPSLDNPDKSLGVAITDDTDIGKSGSGAMDVAEEDLSFTEPTAEGGSPLNLSMKPENEELERNNDEDTRMAVDGVVSSCSSRGLFGSKVKKDAPILKVQPQVQQHPPPVAVSEAALPNPLVLQTKDAIQHITTSWPVSVPNTHTNLESTSESSSVGMNLSKDSCVAIKPAVIVLAPQDPHISGQFIVAPSSTIGNTGNVMPKVITSIPKTLPVQSPATMTIGSGMASQGSNQTLVAVNISQDGIATPVSGRFQSAGSQSVEPVQQTTPSPELRRVPIAGPMTTPPEMRTPPSQVVGFNRQNSQEGPPAKVARMSRGNSMGWQVSVGDNSQQLYKNPPEHTSQSPGQQPQQVSNSGHHLARVSTSPLRQTSPNTAVGTGRGPSQSPNRASLSNMDDLEVQFELCKQQFHKIQELAKAKEREQEELNQKRKQMAEILNHMEMIRQKSRQQRGYAESQAANVSKAGGNYSMGQPRNITAQMGPAQMSHAEMVAIPSSTVPPGVGSTQMPYLTPQTSTPPRMPFHPAAQVSVPSRYPSMGQQASPGMVALRQRMLAPVPPRTQQGAVLVNQQFAVSAPGPPVAQDVMNRRGIQQFNLPSTAPGFQGPGHRLRHIQPHPQPHPPVTTQYLEVKTGYLNGTSGMSQANNIGLIPNSGQQSDTRNTMRAQPIYSQPRNQVSVSGHQDYKAFVVPSSNNSAVPRAKQQPVQAQSVGRQGRSSSDSSISKSDSTIGKPRDKPATSNPANRRSSEPPPAHTHHSQNSGKNNMAPPPAHTKRSLSLERRHSAESLMPPAKKPSIMTTPFAPRRDVIMAPQENSLSKSFSPPPAHSKHPVSYYSQKSREAKEKLQSSPRGAGPAQATPVSSSSAPISGGIPAMQPGSEINARPRNPNLPPPPPLLPTLSIRPPVQNTLHPPSGPSTGQEQDKVSDLTSSQNQTNQQVQVQTSMPITATSNTTQLQKSTSTVTAEASLRLNESVPSISQVSSIAAVSTLSADEVSGLMRAPEPVLFSNMGPTASVPKQDSSSSNILPATEKDLLTPFDTSGPRVIEKIHSDAGSMSTTETSAVNVCTTLSSAAVSTPSVSLESQPSASPAAIPKSRALNLTPSSVSLPPSGPSVNTVPVATSVSGHVHSAVSQTNTGKTDDNPNSVAHNDNSSTRPDTAQNTGHSPETMSCEKEMSTQASDGIQVNMVEAIPTSNPSPEIPSLESRKQHDADHVSPTPSLDPPDMQNMSRQNHTTQAKGGTDDALPLITNAKDDSEKINQEFQAIPCGTDRLDAFMKSAFPNTNTVTTPSPTETASVAENGSLVNGSRDLVISQNKIDLSKENSLSVNQTVTAEVKTVLDNILSKISSTNEFETSIPNQISQHASDVSGKASSVMESQNMLSDGYTGLQVHQLETSPLVVNPNSHGAGDVDIQPLIIEPKDDVHEVCDSFKRPENVMQGDGENNPNRNISSSLSGQSSIEPVNNIQAISLQTNTDLVSTISDNDFHTLIPTTVEDQPMALTTKPLPPMPEQSLKSLSHNTSSSRLSFTLSSVVSTASTASSSIQPQAPEPVQTRPATSDVPTQREHQIVTYRNVVGKSNQPNSDIVDLTRPDTPEANHIPVRLNGPTTNKRGNLPSTRMGPNVDPAQAKAATASRDHHERLVQEEIQRAMLSRRSSQRTYTAVRPRMPAPPYPPRPNYSGPHPQPRAPGSNYISNPVASTMDGMAFHQTSSRIGEDKMQRRYRAVTGHMPQIQDTQPPIQPSQDHFSCQYTSLPRTTASTGSMFSYTGNLQQQQQQQQPATQRLSHPPRQMPNQSQQGVSVPRHSPDYNGHFSNPVGPISIGGGQRMSPPGMQPSAMRPSQNAPPPLLSPQSAVQANHNMPYPPRSIPHTSVAAQGPVNTSYMLPMQVDPSQQQQSFRQDMFQQGNALNQPHGFSMENPGLRDHMNRTHLNQNQPNQLSHSILHPTQAQPHETQQRPDMNPGYVSQQQPPPQQQALHGLSTGHLDQSYMGVQQHQPSHPARHAPYPQMQMQNSPQGNMNTLRHINPSTGGNVPSRGMIPMQIQHSMTSPTGHSTAGPRHPHMAPAQPPAYPNRNQEHMTVQPMTGQASFVNTDTMGTTYQPMRNPTVVAPMQPRNPMHVAQRCLPPPAAQYQPLNQSMVPGSITYPPAGTATTTTSSSVSILPTSALADNNIALVVRTVPGGIVKNCLVCHKEATFLCSGCKNVWYCSPQCQTQSWETHSLVCG